MKKTSTSTRWRIALASVASAAMLVAAPLAAVQTAHAAQPYPPSETLTLGSITAPAGGTLSFTSSSVFASGAAVTALLESTPVVLGHFQADNNGSVSGTVTIPTTTPTGWHVFRLTSDNPDLSVGSSIYVEGGVSQTPTPTPTPTPTHHPKPTPTHHPKPTPTHHPKPEPSHKPEHPGGHDEHGQGDDGRNPDHAGLANHGHDGGNPHHASLAHTGSEKAMALGGAAAALLLTGGGTMLAVRRRRKS
jgi:LPXTG-motif cell wall-anchored protein